MKVTLLQKDFLLTKENNIWLTNPDDACEIIAKDSETLLIVTHSKVLTVRCVSIDRDSKSIQLLYENQKINVKITEPLDELLKSMGLENALTPKVSDVKAPMPGLVLQVLVQAGDEVKKGDKIIVLEAMKMENGIKSPADGVVSEVLVKTGTAVDKNQLLITFK